MRNYFYSLSLRLLVFGLLIVTTFTGIITCFGFI